MYTNVIGADNNLMLIWAIFLFFPLIMACLFNAIYKILQMVKVLPSVQKDTLLGSIVDTFAPEDKNGHRWVIRNTWRTMK